MSQEQSPKKIFTKADILGEVESFLRRNFDPKDDTEKKEWIERYGLLCMFAEHLFSPPLICGTPQDIYGNPKGEEKS